MILRGDMDNSLLIARNAAPNRWLPHSVLPAQVVLDEHQRREQPRVLELHRAELGGDRDPAAPAHLRPRGPLTGSVCIEDQAMHVITVCISLQ